MNKLILLAFVSTAFATNVCATAEELKNANGDVYKINFDVKFKQDVLVPNEGYFLSFGNEQNHAYPLRRVEGVSNAMQFKVKPFETGKPGFQLWSTNGQQIFTWNQGSYEHGYWMWDEENATNKNAKHTRFIFDDAKQSLSANPNDKDPTKDERLGIYEPYAKDPAKTEIYRVEKGANARTKFCFVKVPMSLQRLTNGETFQTAVAKQKGNLFKISENLFKMILKFVHPQQICQLAQTSESMKLKIYSKCKPKLHSRALAWVLVLDDICFPDFTKNCKNLKIFSMPVSEFFVFEKNEIMFAMFGELELFEDNHYKTFMGETNIPDYFYKHKCVDEDVDIYFAHIRGAIYHHFRITNIGSATSARERKNLILISVSLAWPSHFYFCHANDENREYFSYGKDEHQGVFEEFNKLLEDAKNVPFEEDSERVKCLKRKRNP